MAFGLADRRILPLSHGVNWRMCMDAFGKHMDVHRMFTNSLASKDVQGTYQHRKRPHGLLLKQQTPDPCTYCTESLYCFVLEGFLQFKHLKGKGLRIVLYSTSYPSISFVQLHAFMTQVRFVREFLCCNLSAFYSVRRRK